MILIPVFVIATEMIKGAKWVKEAKDAVINSIPRA